MQSMLSLRAMMILTAAAFAVVAPSVADTAPAVGGMPVPGGWSQGRTDDPQVKAAADFAVTQLPGGAKLSRIDAVSQQVVAGMNYRLDLSLSDGSRWQATIYRRFDGTMRLTQSMKLAPVAEPKLLLNGKGLLLTLPGQPARQIAFGTKRAAVMKALSFRPAAGESTNSECGAGPIDFASWPDGLNLLFQGGEFGGWSLDERADTLKADKGLMIGATRQSLEKSGHLKVEESSLGAEFETAGISGVLSNATPRGKVTALWAGLSCVFR